MTNKVPCRANRVEMLTVRRAADFDTVSLVTQLLQHEVERELWWWLQHRILENRLDW